MKRAFLLIYILGFTPSFYSITLPPGGKYILHGTMLSLDGHRIANEKFICDNDTILTDSIGNFKVEISWQHFYCKGYKIKKCNDLINGDFIVFKYKSSNNFVKNKWKKYGLREHKSIYKVNIYWPILYTNHIKKKSLGKYKY